MRILREYRVPERWTLHAYYTLCPYAPDSSGRLLAAAADPAAGVGQVYVFDADGRVVDTFGRHAVESSFYHTGFWQTWSPDARRVYYQSGSLTRPTLTRRDLDSGAETTLDGDAEGAPPTGEPVLSGLLGMLYAAGYGIGHYDAALAPVPFAQRNRHGLFSYTFDPPSERLALSVAALLDAHPDRDRLLRLDRELSDRLGTPAGLTLMAYCVRWNPAGDRLVFYFGNHCVDRARGEPKIACLFTCRRDLSELRLALDLARGGVHWSWHPDGERLVGYALPPGEAEGSPWRLCSVRHDGNDFRRLCDAQGGGHPSMSPADPLLAVSDAGDKLQFWDLADNRLVAERQFPNTCPGGGNHGRRDPTRACLHPVFTPDGKAVLINSFDGNLCRLLEIAAPERG